MSRRLKDKDYIRGEELVEQRKFQYVHMIWHPFLDLPVPCDNPRDVNQCPYWDECENDAGRGTLHAGVGACSQHNRSFEKVAGALQMAHLIAQALDITPWEALLLAVRRAAAWSAFYQYKLSQVTNDDDLRLGGSAYDWVLASERANNYLVRWSKLAIDAGVARMMIERVQNEGSRLATIINQAISESEFDNVTELQFRKALRKVLEEMSSNEAVAEMPALDRLSASEPYVDPEDRWKDDKRWYGGKE